MGCSSGAADVEQPPGAGATLRQRLVNAAADFGAAKGRNQRKEVSEEDQRILEALAHARVLDFLEGRRYVVGSEPDQHITESFSSKSVKLEGTTFDAKGEGIGFACKKGLKPEAPNQDSFFIIKLENDMSLYGVFDGHGRNGHDISNFVSENLPKIILAEEELRRDPAVALASAFEKMQYLIEKATAMGTIDATRSGTTGSVVLHMRKEGMIHVAHLGDSRVVLAQGELLDGVKKVKSVDLTVDHKPELPRERERIEKAGGTVMFDGGWNHRVYAQGKLDSSGRRYPGLNMSRAFGDLNGSHDAGISASPDVQSRPLLPIIRRRPLPGASPVDPHPLSGRVACQDYANTTDQFLLLCSDGVWEFLSSERAVQTVGQFSSESAPEAAEQLAEASWDLWMSQMAGQVADDITVVVIFLEQPQAQKQQL